MAPEVGVWHGHLLRTDPLISFPVADPWLAALPGAGPHTAHDFSFCASFILSLSLFGNPTAANLPGCRCPVKKNLHSHLHISRQCDERQKCSNRTEERGDVVF